MKEIPVNFENEGQKISGVLHLPDKKTSFAIVVAHGYAGNKTHYKDFGKFFSKNGFAVLRFDFRGSGESEGKFIDMTLEGEASDLKKAIDFVSTRGYTKIGLFGHSLGGAIAMMCGTNKNLKAIVLSASSSYFEGEHPEWLTKKFIDKILQNGSAKVPWNTSIVSGIAFYRSIMKFDAKKLISQIKIPVLILHGNKDDVINWKNSERLFNFANKPKKIVIIKGADHSINPPYQQEAFDATLDWFNKWLK